MNEVRRLFILTIWIFILSSWVCINSGATANAQSGSGERISFPKKNRSRRSSVKPTAKPKSTGKSRRVLSAEVSVPTAIVSSNERMLAVSPDGDELEVLEFNPPLWGETSSFDNPFGEKELTKDAIEGVGDFAFAKIKIRYRLVSTSSCRIFGIGYYKGEWAHFSGSSLYRKSGVIEIKLNLVHIGDNNFIDEVRIEMMKADENRNYKDILVLVVRFKK